MVSYKLIGYVLFCIFIGLNITVQLTKSNRVIAAFLYLGLVLAVFSLFGLRWFGPSGGAEGGIAWPPIMNTCPDYLTYHEISEAGKKMKGCIDLVGVSKTCDFKKWNNTASKSSGNVNFFELLDTDSFTTKCQKAKDFGLSWEACDSMTPAGGSGSGGNGTCNN